MIRINLQISKCRRPTRSSRKVETDYGIIFLRGRIIDATKVVLLRGIFFLLLSTSLLRTWEGMKIARCRNVILLP